MQYTEEEITTTVLFSSDKQQRTAAWSEPKCTRLGIFLSGLRKLIVLYPWLVVTSTEVRRRNEEGWRRICSNKAAVYLISKRKYYLYTSLKSQNNRQLFRRQTQRLLQIHSGHTINTFFFKGCRVTRKNKHLPPSYSNNRVAFPEFCKSCQILARAPWKSILVFEKTILYIHVNPRSYNK